MVWEEKRKFSRIPQFPRFPRNRPSTWNGAISISRDISIKYKFYNCNCSKNKNYKIKSPLSLWYTNWSHLNCLLELYSDFYFFLWPQMKIQNMKAKSARTFLYFTFLIFIYNIFWLGSSPSNTEGLRTIWLNIVGAWKNQSKLSKAVLFALKMIWSKYTVAH